MRNKAGIRKAAGNPYLQARAASMSMFAGIEHRMQTIREWNGITFINDSKSTDIESSYYSLELIEAPITWIIGSTDFETNYAHVEKFVKYKVVNLIVFGSHADNEISNNFKSLVDHYKYVASLDEAFQKAMHLTNSGTTLLFSPSCNSFDLYEDYHERGNHFNELVNKLN